MKAPEIHIIAVEDPNSKMITGWIREYSGIVAEGRNKEELKQNLGILLNEYLRIIKETFEKSDFNVVNVNYRNNGTG